VDIISITWTIGIARIISITDITGLMGIIMIMLSGITIKGMVGII